MPLQELYENAYETTLDNGLRILTEEVPQSRSVSVGVWVRAGSRDEPAARHGLAHFIEHLAFKGSTSRSARDISHAIDEVGGDLNAATAKESTFYYADVPQDGLEVALDLLADLTLHPRFAASDVDLERNVILEEIRGHEDDTEQMAYDLFSAGLWADHHPFARSVVGTKQAITSVRPDDVHAFHDVFYHPANMILAACGAVDARRLAELSERYFATPSRNGAPRLPERQPPTFRTGTVHHERPTGMTHVYIGAHAPNAAHDDRIPLEVVNSVFGDGTSSRLFHEIRESRGLAYVVTSFVNSFSDGGLWLTYAGSSPDNADTVIGLIREEMDRLLTEPIPDAEFSLAKAKLRGHLILGLEANSHRASRLANAALQGRELLSPDALLRRLDAVTREGAQETLAQYLRADELNITTVGPRP